MLTSFYVLNFRLFKLFQNPFNASEHLVGFKIDISPKENITETESSENLIPFILVSNLISFRLPTFSSDIGLG